VVTVLAVGFLLLDAVLLASVAVWDGRPWFFAWSLVFVALAAVVIHLRRRYVRTLDEIRRAREQLKRDLRAVQPSGPAAEDAP
jgi:uncharacterized membrane protein YqjE